MKPYPEYKDSGVEWIGEIPARWGQARMKHISTIQSSNIDKKQHENANRIRIVHYNDVVKNDFICNNYLFGFGYCSESQLRAFGLNQGDIVITKDSMDVTNIADVCLIQDELNDTAFGYHLSKFSITDSQVESKYLFYFLKNCQIKRDCSIITEFPSILLFAFDRFCTSVT